MAQYSAQAYNRNPLQGSSSRRHPFTNAVNHQQQLKPQPSEKQPPSPPLPRQNAKITPPSPPKIIYDKNGSVLFSRVGFLGEGGFARVYEVKETNGTRLACKVVTKSSLKTKKAKTKLYAEIKIHRSLEHPNIVRFQDCYEDDEHVYLALELCPSGSLMELLRRRRRFSEPEARFFMVQLMGACHYMHTHQVIHRDLKLGNLLLDANMNLKVGDFGLAALIENPGERKKTICGTPNYIAPEVLFDTVNGHSFEVDTWSIGVILYTLVVGRPPFQTSEVKEIYKRIRNNEYDFPPERSVSAHAQALIQQILTPNPAERPTLHEIVDHLFFTNGTVPSYIPTSAHDAPPDFRSITRAQSQSNLRRLRRYSLMDEDQTTSIAVPKAPASSNEHHKTTTSSVAQQEKEFQKAVQPGSPISALLSSARQPLLMANNGSQPGMTKETPLLRKLQAVKESPLRKSAIRGPAMNDIEEEGGLQGPAGFGRVREEHLIEEQRVRKKQLEAQKARIVAQMAPVREEEEDRVNPKVKAQYVEREPERVRPKERENFPPATSTISLVSKGKERERSVNKEHLPTPGYAVPAAKSMPQLAPSMKSLPPPPPPPNSGRPLPSSDLPPPRPTSGQAASQLTGFEAAAHVLMQAFDAKDAGLLFHDPRENSKTPIPDERVFIVSWVDYCNKYGMGYALTDGSVGVYFNDSTTVALSPDKHHFDYITSRHQGMVCVRKPFTVDTYPPELKSKMYLLKHFEHYILERLHGEYDYAYEDVDRTHGMEWVQKYLRMKNVIVFKLSHDVIQVHLSDLPAPTPAILTLCLQFNFFDHQKIVLSSHGLRIIHIDNEYNLTRWKLIDVMDLALQPPIKDPEAHKFNQRLVERLRFCKEVLVSICKASAAGLQPGDCEPVSLPSQTINSKASKAALRS
ncbi:hypothetical protein DXG01_014672 [Tephrocybe rancida]|nr:hypothetical protein DXG01_014672 [Tephrocybe rancida]